jgi:hypothetical protein
LSIWDKLLATGYKGEGSQTPIDVRCKCGHQMAYVGDGPVTIEETPIARKVQNCHLYRCPFCGERASNVAIWQNPVDLRQSVTIYWIFKDGQKSEIEGSDGC